ncbi:MAG: hypothetical protein ACETWK_13455 [Candidatus Aminicenantaceae bacterium]
MNKGIMTLSSVNNNQEKSNLREILEQMKKKKAGYIYEGVMPDTIKEIRKISTRNFDYTEIVFKGLEKNLLRQMANDAGLNYEKKKRTVDFTCERCPMRQEHASDGEPSNAYIITKPKRFWFSAVIADVVNNSVRIYDTREGVEIGAVILEQYLKKSMLPRTENGNP